MNKKGQVKEHSRAFQPLISRGHLVADGGPGGESKLPLAN